MNPQVNSHSLLKILTKYKIPDLHVDNNECLILLSIFVNVYLMHNTSLQVLEAVYLTYSFPSKMDF